MVILSLLFQTVQIYREVKLNGIGAGIIDDDGIWLFNQVFDAICETYAYLQITCWIKFKPHKKGHIASIKNLVRIIQATNQKAILESDMNIEIIGKIKTKGQGYIQVVESLKQVTLLRKGQTRFYKPAEVVKVYFISQSGIQTKYAVRVGAVDTAY